MFFYKLTQGLAFIILFTQLVAGGSIVQRAPQCTDFVVPVTIKGALNADLPLTLNLFDLLSGVLSIIFDIPISGTYDIAARYCEPEVFVSTDRSNTVQILSHGATYDKNYWSADSFPGTNPATDQYSWLAYASKEGYPTFSFDRLGAGASAKPDPILVVQVPAQVEIAHQLNQMLRTHSPLFGSNVPRAFSRIIHAGHSFGSIIDQELTVKYPNDCDAIILTGFSKSILAPAAGVLITAGPEPAYLVDPVKYPLATTPAGYLEPNSFDGIKFLFWYGTNYDPAFMQQDYNLRGTITLGEGATGPPGLATAPGFTGSVFVISGDKDVVFCSVTGSVLTGPGNCGGTSSSGLLAQTETLYPNAANYEFYALPNAGHCWQFHLNSQDGFDQAFAWLGRQGF